MSKTGFRVSVVCDSISDGVRLTTFACRFPRVVLAEMNTHRAISKNAASSRAIPVNHFIEQVESDAYAPRDLPDGELMGNSPGMEAMSPLDADQKGQIGSLYCSASVEAVVHARSMASCGAHKQDVNRLLEPFQWVRWVGTATNWDNFFALRTDHRAYPPFRFLSRCMWVAYTRSVPVERQWHLPFVTEADWEYQPLEMSPVPDWEWLRPSLWPLDGVLAPSWAYNLAAWSAARCARVSVKNFRTDSTDRMNDMKTFEKLTTDTPRHSSPLEHQAFALNHWSKSYPGSNFSQPWFQFRKMMPEETAWEFDPPAEVVAEWNVPDDVFGGTPGVDW